MQFAGLQKLTLLDYPNHVACTIFTGGCNFQCPFCHNSRLIKTNSAPDLNPDEILTFLKKRQGLLDGVAVSGGEPLMWPDLGEFLAKVKELGYKVKLDTNGSFPKRLKELVREGLVDKVAMDIKNSPDLYGKTVGVDVLDISPIEESKDFLLSGAADYEFRTTVVKGLHTKESLVDTTKWISGAKEYYLQQYRDSGDILNADGLSAFSDAEMYEFAEAVSPIIPSVQVRGVDDK